jgi:hypothetical protein
MGTPTYTPLATITLTTNAASVIFGSIPDTYRDLVLVVTSRITGGGSTVRFNNDSGNNYAFIYHRGGPAGNVVTSADFSSGIPNGSGVGESTTSFTSYRVNIMDYATTNKHKSCVVHYGDATGSQNTASTYVRWGNTAAITNVRIVNTSANLEAGSTFSLYGIAS